MSKELTRQERTSFALSKVASAMKWMALSGAATIFLTELLSGLKEVDMPVWLAVLLTAIIDALIFGIAKYKEGQE